MKGNEQVIEALNAGLTIELTAINTYFIHSKMCLNWGLKKLADHYYAESIEEMKHAEEIIDRLGWLTVTDITSEQLPSLAAFAEEVRDAGFKRVVLLGMGGSSLGPSWAR